jgi:hypothetical protein
MGIKSVRNFWIELDVDGRASSVATGPRAKDGGFNLNIFVRDNGSSKKAMSVCGRVINNELQISVHMADGTYLVHSTNK